MTKNSEDQLDIYFELGKKKVFACALQWPGWCRPGRNEDDAKNALLTYSPRYTRIIGLTDLVFPSPSSVNDFTVIDRIEGNFATSYGVPNLPIPADYTLLSEGQIDRFSKIIEACWVAFDQATRSAMGKELRKGPRGGGRELQEIVSHVALAERGYLRHLGWSGDIPDIADTSLWMSQLHRELFKGVHAAARGEYPAKGPQGGKRWPLAYFFRRVAWHVVDHTWEIEDRITSK